MVDFPLKTVVEGKTPIIVPDVDAIKKESSNFPPGDAPVFYNKVMELNRDFALIALRIFNEIYSSSKSILYCEPMAGSGIRSVRIANEIENIEVIINDRNPIAVELINKNVKHLKLKKKTKVFTEDANSLMLRFAAEGKLFDVIDIDPFGSPSQFIDSTAQAIRKDGLIAVTSTDMATMCGVYPKACIRKYFSKPIHSSIAHELSIRMLIGFIVMGLARHEKATQPLFAHSTAHYIRVYVLAKKGITKAKETMEHLGYIAHCQECFSMDYSLGIINHLSKTCPNCQTKWLIGGPFWLGKLYDEKFVKSLDKELSDDSAPYSTIKKMRKIVSLIKEEVKSQSSQKAMLGFYDLHQIADKLDIPSPKLDATISELRNKGHIATRTHFRTNSIKTDASIKAIINTMKKVLGL